MAETRQIKARRRDDQQFTQRIATRIWQEEPLPENPYVAAHSRCHGYELDELVSKRRFPDVLFLLFRGELPEPQQARLLERLMIGLINPGPRHPATRAAMNAGVGKTDPVHLLPLSLAVLGGDHLGAGEVEPAMRFLNKAKRRAPEAVAEELLAALNEVSAEGVDRHPAPGFGNRFGSVDPQAARLAGQLLELAGPGSALAWGAALAQHLVHAGFGWLSTGVAAATFADLGLLPRAAPGLYQLLCAPGLLAHGVEMSNKPLTAMPFISDENYVIEPDPADHG